MPDWNSFGPQLDELRKKLTENAPNRRCPDLLFRGHENSEWRLSTTLERAGCEKMSFGGYYHRAVGRTRPAVETFTGVRWEVPEYSLALEESFRTDYELFSGLGFPSVELYRYLVYLRHHGFPSPLLDWTASSNVAAFFAFRRPGTAKRSIYVYCERPNVAKGGAVGEPAMRAIGPYVRSHPRHFRQQSNYTICAAFDRDGGGWYFHPHEPVFGHRGTQDFLWKFNLPATERTDVLRKFDGYNLNAFSLFDAEEALLETMWFREHVLKVQD